MITKDDLELKMTMCLDSEDGGQMFYRDERLKIQFEIHTPKKSGKWGNESAYFQ